MRPEMVMRRALIPLLLINVGWYDPVWVPSVPVKFSVDMVPFSLKVA